MDPPSSTVPPTVPPHPPKVVSTTTTPSQAAATATMRAIVARAPSAAASSTTHVPEAVPATNGSLEQRIDSVERFVRHLATTLDTLSSSVKTFMEDHVSRHPDPSSNLPDTVRLLESRHAAQEARVNALQASIDAADTSEAVASLQRRLDTLETQARTPLTPSTAGFDPNLSVSVLGTTTASLLDATMLTNELGNSVPRSAQNALNISQAVAKLNQLDTPETLNLKKARDKQPHNVSLTGDIVKLFPFICDYNTYREACRVASVIPLPLGSCLSDNTCMKIGIELPIPFPISAEHASALTQQHCLHIFQHLYEGQPYLTALASFIVPEPWSIHESVAFRSQVKKFFDRLIAIGRFPVRRTTDAPITYPFLTDSTRILDIFMLGLPYGHILFDFIHYVNTTPLPAASRDRHGAPSDHPLEAYISTGLKQYADLFRAQEAHGLRHTIADFNHMDHIVNGQRVPITQDFDNAPIFEKMALIDRFRPPHLTVLSKSAPNRRATQSATATLSSRSPRQDGEPICNACGNSAADCPKGAANHLNCPWLENHPYAQRSGHCKYPIPATRGFSFRFGANHPNSAPNGFPAWLTYWQNQPDHPGRLLWSKALRHLLPDGWNDKTSPTQLRAYLDSSGSAKSPDFGPSRSQRTYPEPSPAAASPQRTATPSWSTPATHMDRSPTALRDHTSPKLTAGTQAAPNRPSTFPNLRAPTYQRVSPHDSTSRSAAIHVVDPIEDRDTFHAEDTDTNDENHNGPSEQAFDVVPAFRNIIDHDAIDHEPDVLYEYVDAHPDDALPDDDPQWFDYTTSEHAWRHRYRHHDTVVPINLAETHLRSRPTVKVTINGSPLTLLADSGAAVTVMSRDLFRQAHANEPTTPSSITLQFGNAQTLPVDVTVSLAICFLSVHLPTFRSVVHIADLPAKTFLMSFDDMYDSGLGHAVFPALPHDKADFEFQRVCAINVPTHNNADIIVDDPIPFSDLVADEPLPTLFDDLPSSDEPKYEFPDLSHLAGNPYLPRYKSLIQEFKQLFRDRLPEHPASLPPMPIEFDEAKLRNQPLPTRRPVAAPLLAIMREKIDEMLRLRVIAPSDHWFQSPVVMVKQKGAYRFCVDYRTLNSATTPKRFPIPLNRDTFQQMKGKRVLTLLDNRKGYYQLLLTAAATVWTTFWTPIGSYKYLRIPFGLVSAPAYYNFLIVTLVLTGLIGLICVAYFDDTVVFSDNHEQHLKGLRTVFERFAKYNLTLNGPKCAIAKSEVAFWGHLVDGTGYNHLPERQAKALSYPRPNTRKQLERFLGLATYFSAHLENFALLRRRLAAIATEKSLHWTDDATNAFNELKSSMLTLRSSTSLTTHWNSTKSSTPPSRASADTCINSARQLKSPSSLSR